VRIENGPDVLADDAYIRESILDAKAKTVYGFAQVMPLFQGQITEEEVVQLIEYVKSLAAPPAGGMPSSSGETPEDWGTDPGITQPGVSSITGSKTGKR
jgi:cytochrome c oxidase subunit 2